ncbi:MAG: GNAT family protein [Planctomycetota bacterium]
MAYQFKANDGMALLLKHPEAADIPRLYEAADISRVELAPWMDWCHADFCIADAEKWVLEQTAQANVHAFIIIDEQTGLCLGTCGLHDISRGHRYADLGYWVRTSHLGRGIAPAAARKVAEIAFYELELVRLEIVVDLRNLKSQRVAEKVGAKREGVIRNGLVHSGIPKDAVLFSLIPSDFAD